MKQRGIGDRFSLLNNGTGQRQGTRPRGRKNGSAAPSGRSLRGSCFQASDQLVEPELLEPLADGLQLRRRELDQALALLAELERLAQAGLVGVEPADDL